MFSPVRLRVRSAASCHREEAKMTEEHVHEWGEVEKAWLTGNPHRKCQVEGCKAITLDLSDEEEGLDEEEEN